MSFRRRVAIVSAAAVAVAVVLASLVTYLLASHLLRGQIDSQLRERAAGLQHLRGPRAGVPPQGRDGDQHPPNGAQKLTQPPGGPHGSQQNPFGSPPPQPDEVRGYQQLIDSKGNVWWRSTGPSGLTLPVSSAERRVAAGHARAFFSDATVGGVDLRILAEPVEPGFAFLYAQPLTGVNHLLSHLRLILGLIDIAGVLLAALLGLLVSGAAVAPVRRLTQAIEHVTRTQDLSRRIEPAGEDEIGRLAEGFNAMLDALGDSMRALDASVGAQRQLVADASHELRTPVTSLRTNIEILQRARDMDERERDRLLCDVVEQTEELTLLVGDLIDLARGEQVQSDLEQVRLDAVVTAEIERARRNSPETPIEAELEPTVVTGLPDRLGRAVKNLIENALKYSPPGSPVDVELHDGTLTVADRGPGIPADERPHVFDRFFRGRDVRGRPGSGLGLAIVRQVVEQHAGSVSAEDRPGGGTVMRVVLSSSPSPAEAHRRAQTDRASDRPGLAVARSARESGSV